MKLLCITALVCSLYSLARAEAPPATRLSAPIPTLPGHTRLRYSTSVDGKPEDWCVVVSNSKKISQTRGAVPVLIFLCGVGDRGRDGDRIFDNGPPAEMQRHADLQDNLPMIVISPQCPPDHEWGDAGMDEPLTQLVELLIADPRVDRNRIYLTGLSMGGKGAWHIAAAKPGYFAAMAVIASKTVPPELVLPAVKELPIWIVVGGDDGRITQTSRAMAAALGKAGVDVLFSELPGIGHQSWEMVYPKMEFYDWLAGHTRGKPSAKKYSNDELLKIAAAPVIDPVNDKVVHDFDGFAKYWQILNCSREGNPGLRPELNGRKNVMVVRPLSAQTPCRMQTTWQIPPDKHAHLKIIAGRDGGDWKLSVHADGNEVFSTAIDQSTARDGWLNTSIDLGAWSGKSCHLDVFISQMGDHAAPAILEKLAVEW